MRYNLCILVSVFLAFLLLSLSFNHTIYIVTRIYRNLDSSVEIWKKKDSPSAFIVNKLKSFKTTSAPNPATYWEPKEVKEFRIATSKSLPNSVLHVVKTTLRQSPTVKPTESIQEKQVENKTILPDPIQVKEQEKKVVLEELNERKTTEFIMATEAKTELPEVNKDEQENEDSELIADSTTDSVTSSNDVKADDESDEINEYSDSIEEVDETPSTNPSNASTSHRTKIFRPIITKRFKFRKGKKSGIPASACYFPPDHVSDQRSFDLLRAKKRIEHRELAKLVRSGKNSSFSYTEQMLEFKKRSKMMDKQQLETMHLEKISKLVRFSKDSRFCEGCSMEPTFLLKTSENVKKLIFRKFEGNKEIRKAQLYDSVKYPDENAPFEVTSIMVTTKHRLFFISQLFYRWEGPMIIVVNGKTSEEEAILEYISTHFLPSRLTILLYLVYDKKRESEDFPVNLLRNLAIRNVKSSHYMIMDMDMWVTTNAYRELKKIPASIYSNSTSAVILPIFFYNKISVLSFCNSFTSCIALGLELFPENKTRLTRCIASGYCLSSKGPLRTHFYVLPSWYGLPNNSAVSKIRCMIVDFQEPYVMLKRTENTPLFDEHFVNYGYNKVQLIEHLRAAGFQFYILNNAFAMDMPHTDSSFKQTYMVSYGSDYLPMREAYRKFQKELNRRYDGKNRFPVCKTRNLNIYTPIFS